MTSTTSPVEQAVAQVHFATLATALSTLNISRSNMNTQTTTNSGGNSSELDDCDYDALDDYHRIGVVQTCD